MTDEDLIVDLNRLFWLLEEDRQYLARANTARLAARRIEALIAARDTMGNLWAKEKKRSRRLQDGLMEAIRLAEQPHYGDQEDALDHCFEAIDVLRTTLAELTGDKT